MARVQRISFGISDMLSNVERKQATYLGFGKRSLPSQFSASLEEIK